VTLAKIRLCGTLLALSATRLTMNWANASASETIAPAVRHRNSRVFSGISLTV
jgi:hypothetical protein